MRILQINKFYYVRGGAERYLFELKDVLEKKGHQAIPFSMFDKKNFSSVYEKYFVSHIELRQVKGLFQKIKTAKHVIWSKEAAQKLELLIQETKPDLAHLHNISHQLSPSILYVLKKYKIPMVQTLHDYKLIAPNYNLFRNDYSDLICHYCANPPYRWWKSFTHRCLGSWSEQWLLAFETMLHKILKSYSLIDCFIAPSDFMKYICVSFGVPEAKIIVLPYALDLNGARSLHYNEGNEPLHEPLNNYLLYFGRLSKEKGVDVLIEAMKNLPDIKLKIVGTGPEEKNLKVQFQEVRPPNIEFVGYKSGEELKGIIRNAQAIVVPSIWYENSPLVIYEAFASGKPVIASRIGGMPELVQNKKTGFLAEPGDHQDLAEKISQFVLLPEKQKLIMGEAARKFAEKYFGPEQHYEKLMEVYEKIRNEK